MAAADTSTPTAVVQSPMGGDVGDALDTMDPLDLLAFLEGKLDEQVEVIQEADDYYNGKQRLAFATAKFRETFARYFPPLAINWMKVVVDTPAARLSIQGFRFDPDPTKPTWEIDADDDAWTIWQASNMDSGSQIVHTDAIKYGVSYVMVVPPVAPDGDSDADDSQIAPDQPRIIPEHPSEVYVYLDPADRRTRLAAIKRWRNELDGYAYANVFTADTIYHFRSDKPLGRKTVSSKFVWVADSSDDDVESAQEDNPIGVVPIIPVENKPDLQYGGRSDLEEAIAIQDAINKYCLDMQVSSEFHGYPQRYATGWTAPTDEQGNELSGREVEVKMGVTRLLTSEDENTQFGQLMPGDVKNYIDPIETYIDMLGSITATPSYALKGQMANLSADAMHAADSGLVDRCRRKINNAFSDNWEDVMRTAFLAMGDATRGNAQTAEVVWQDPERRSISQNIDAAVKMRTSLSVPIEMCWQTLGWTPAQIKMAREMMNLPPGGPGVLQVNPPSVPQALIQDPASGEFGKGTEPTIKEGPPVVLGPNGNPLPNAQQPNGAGGTQPAGPPKPAPNSR